MFLDRVIDCRTRACQLVELVEQKGSPREENDAVRQVDRC